MNSKKCIKLLLIIVVGLMAFMPVKANAYNVQKEYKTVNVVKINHSLAEKKSSTEDMDDCKSLLGNPENTSSTAWLLQEIFSVIKYAGPFLLLIFSSVDFAKVIVQSDDDTMHKAQKKLLIRIICVLLLFFVPDLIMILFQLIGFTTDPTCGIG